MEYDYEAKLGDPDCNLWSQSINWQIASRAYIAGRSENSKSVLIEFELPDCSKFCAPFILNGKYLTNIDRLYTPHFNILTYALKNNNSLSTFESSVFFFHSCIISPVLEQDISFFSIINSIKFSKFEYTVNWQAFSSSAFEYWGKRPTILINTIRRKRAKCNKAHCEFKLFTNISIELRQHYWQVYNRSWKPAEASPDFVNWLLDYTSEQGLLRLGFTYIDSRPIAMHFWIVQDGTASIFKLAQDKEFDHLSPGTVLMAEMVDWVYAHDEIHCIDFLTGSDEYKKLWMDECRPLYGLEIFNLKTIRGRFLWYRHCIIRFLKSIRSRFVKHE